MVSALDFGSRSLVLSPGQGTALLVYTSRDLLISDSIES